MLRSTYPHACLSHFKSIHVDKSIGGFRILARQYGNDGQVLARAGLEGPPALPFGLGRAGLEGPPALPFGLGRVKIQCGLADAIDRDVRHAAVSRLGINIGQRTTPERKTRSEEHT